MQVERNSNFSSISSSSSSSSPSSSSSSASSSSSVKRSADQFESGQKSPYLLDVLRQISRVGDTQKLLGEIENELKVLSEVLKEKQRDPSSLEDKVLAINLKASAAFQQLDALQKYHVRDCQTIGNNQKVLKKARHEGPVASSSSSASQRPFPPLSSSFASPVPIQQQGFESLSSSYSSRSLSGLLDLLGDKKMADVVFEVKEEKESQHVFAHRAVLAQQSAALNALLFDPLKEGLNIDTPIPIPQCSYSAFQSILSYFYTGELKLKSGILKEIYIFADLWGVENLKEICGHHFEVMLKPSNAIQLMCETYLVANSLYKEAKAFVAGNMNAVFASKEDYQQLPKDVFLNLLKEDQLFLSELEIFRWAVKWLEVLSEVNQELLDEGLEVEQEVNQELIDEVMKHIRFHHISPEDQWAIVLKTSIEGMVVKEGTAVKEKIAVMKEKDLIESSTAFYEDNFLKPTQRGRINRWLTDKFMIADFSVRHIGEDACLFYWRIPRLSQQIKDTIVSIDQHGLQAQFMLQQFFAMQNLNPAHYYQPIAQPSQPQNSLAQPQNTVSHSIRLRSLRKELNVQSPPFEMHGKTFTLHLVLEDNNLRIFPKVSDPSLWPNASCEINLFVLPEKQPPKSLEELINLENDVLPLGVYMKLSQKKN